MSTDIPDNHDVVDIYLFAVNSGELYPLHTKLAADNAGLAQWVEHVRGTVKRLYRAQIDRHCFPFTGTAVVDAAGQLRDYYRGQMSEQARLRSYL